ncbi:O-antigen ligase family protein [Methylobacterium sp. P31]
MLGIVLAGYALFGKGFAYIGYSPFFIGEITLVLGILAALNTRCLLASFVTLPAFLLLCLILFILARTLPYVENFGFDALRDSVVATYGLYAFVVIALLLERSARIEMILTFYGRFACVFTYGVPASLVTSLMFRDYLPRWPGSGTPIIWVQTGEAAVHLAGVCVFFLGGFARAPRYAIVFLIAALALIVPQSRGAMLAFVVPVCLAMLLLGRARTLIVGLVVAGSLFGIAYLLESTFVQYRPASSSEDRSVSTRQVIDNVSSIFGSGNDQTEGTKQWRVDWWNLIIQNTIHGQYFWTGRGFGLNLADADGFRPNQHSLEPPLRSPHNVFMTVLARAGVPGSLLWAGVLLSWSWLLLSNVARARAWRLPRWASMFVLTWSYGLAAIINATFDPALEGPMQGIWFWCVYGFGVGAAMAFRVLNPAVDPTPSAAIRARPS